MKYRIIIFSLLCYFSCDTITKKPKVSSDYNSMPSNTITKNSNDIEIALSENTKGMIFVKGGEFEMGGDNNEAKQDEFPKHKVTLNSFWMDETEVTNDQFKEFVNATGYITTAEKAIDWNEIKKIVPPGTPKPHDSLLAPASLIFYETEVTNLNNYTQWWRLEKNTNWRSPFGKDSNINNKGNHPVVHISWDDAIAYCKWAGKRLPTEAEFEYASRGGLKNNIYSWGNEPINQGKLKANTWEGKFPSNNKMKDKFYYTAPVKSFEPNGFGFYDLGGNVWEWCSDWFSPSFHQLERISTRINPKGPDNGSTKVMKGGSYLCHESYCNRYRVAARSQNTPDSSTGNLGFRTIYRK